MVSGFSICVNEGLIIDGFCFVKVAVGVLPKNMAMIIRVLKERRDVNDESAACLRC